MLAVHARFGVTQAAFNALVSDPTHTMDRNRIPMRARTNLLVTLTAMEPQIVTR
jgi:hypothetical protein